MNRIIRPLSKHLPNAARILLGLVFFVFGLNGFLHFLPQPPLPAAGISFMSWMTESGYMFPVLKAFEVAAGLMLLASFMVPLALTLLAPIIVNIVLFHLFLVPNPGMIVLLLTLELYLAWSYREAFAPMLRVHVKPAAPRVSEGTTGAFDRRAHARS